MSSRSISQETRQESHSNVLKEAKLPVTDEVRTAVRRLYSSLRNGAERHWGTDPQQAPLKAYAAQKAEKLTDPLQVAALYLLATEERARCCAAAPMYGSVACGSVNSGLDIPRELQQALKARLREIAPDLAKRVAR